MERAHAGERPDRVRAGLDAPAAHHHAVHPAGLAVHHLGRYGTERKKLGAWTLTP
jgi:hypothetical protein